MSSQPPRFVPTLTEVVQPANSPGPFTDGTSAAAVDRADEERLVQRILARVNLILEGRLREALGQLILDHTERLTPRLREEIESVVRQSVSDAFGQELKNDKHLSGS